MISIIVPVYNVERYVGKCLESLIKQTYRDIEIIIVDDGSEDQSFNICQKYASADTRIHLFHHDTCMGVSSARNQGLKVARGEYIAFVDSDDYVDEYMYEKLIEAIERKNADIAICNYLLIQENIVKNDESFEKTKYTTFESDEKYKIIYFGKRYGIVLWNKLYKRKVFEGVSFPEDKFCEDNYVIQHLLFNAERVCCIEYVGYFYRVRENSITTSKSIERIEQDLDACRYRIEFFKHIEKEELYNKAITELLSRIVGLYSKEKNRVFKEKLMKMYNMYYRILDKGSITLRLKSVYFLFAYFPEFGSKLHNFILKLKKC